eukprot:5726172-Pyramimonas_sp.AAC.1
MLVLFVPLLLSAAQAHSSVGVKIALSLQNLRALRSWGIRGHPHIALILVLLPYLPILLAPPSILALRSSSSSGLFLILPILSPPARPLALPLPPSTLSPCPARRSTAFARPQDRHSIF